jgi:XTP/dITP diphosphohydrolase
MTRNLLISTRNNKKKIELQSILSTWDVKLLTLDDFEGLPEIEEDGTTFVENALKKARIIAQLTNCTTLADDSGLVVDALGGAPGVYSARFAGLDADDSDNNRRLLELMKDIEEDQRTARFICVIAVAAPTGLVKTVEGVCEGRIETAGRGEGGFGYDPLFVPEGFTKTFAELTEDEKNRISHRGRALQEAKYLLQLVLGMEGKA